MRDGDGSWERSAGGRPPRPLWLLLALAPLLLCWTLPQSLAGLALAALGRVRGRRLRLYAFGPFLFLVVRGPGPLSAGISLGLVVLARSPDLLTHEFCHLYSGLWLGWLYLPVYGLEYLTLGHDRSWHERVTVALQRRTRWGWRALGGRGRG